MAGGSTISQQLAKNLFLSASRTPWRKGQEALITVMIEHVMDKRRILEIYLNVIEWGDGVFGAEAAARHYYGIERGRARRPRPPLGSPRSSPIRACYDRNRTTPFIARKIADDPRAHAAGRAALAVRLFFALWPDDAVRGAWSARLESRTRAQGKAVPAAKLHLTLAFLGEVADDRVARSDRCRARASRARRSSSAGRYVGAFRDAQVAWVGLPPPCHPALAALPVGARGRACAGEASMLDDRAVRRPRDAGPPDRAPDSRAKRSARSPGRCATSRSWRRIRKGDLRKLDKR